MQIKSSEMISAASYAYLGDAVFELMVREKLIGEHNVKPGALHSRAVKLVNASAQSKMAKRLLEKKLDAEEAAVYKRGRNTAVNSMPKNADIAEYCMATGLEAVFGRLYLSGKTDRLNELFEFCMDTIGTE